MCAPLLLPANTACEASLPRMPGELPRFPLSGYFPAIHSVNPASVPEVPSSHTHWRSQASSRKIFLRLKQKACNSPGCPTDSLLALTRLLHSLRCFSIRIAKISPLPPHQGKGPALYLPLHILKLLPHPFGARTHTFQAAPP